MILTSNICDQLTEMEKKNTMEDYGYNCSSEANWQPINKEPQ